MYQQNAYRPPSQFSVFPPVIKNLLIINGIVFLAQNTGALGDYLLNWFALWPLGTPGETLRFPAGTLQHMIGFWPWQLVTYGFLHGGSFVSPAHILFNMFALWMFGIQIENTWGSKRFATYYFICVIGAGLAQLLVALLNIGFSPASNIVYPTLGASGGVFGILLAFGMLFPNQYIYLYFLVPVKAKWFVIFYGLFELFAGVSGFQPGVANFAHLGGMVFGFLMIQYWRGKLPIRPERQQIY